PRHRVGRQERLQCEDPNHDPEPGREALLLARAPQLEQSERGQGEERGNDRNAESAGGEERDGRDPSGRDQREEGIDPGKSAVPRSKMRDPPQDRERQDPTEAQESDAQRKRVRGDAREILDLRNLSGSEIEQRLASQEPGRTSRVVGEERERAVSPEARALDQSERASDEAGGGTRAREVRFEIDVGRARVDPPRRRIVPQMQIEPGVGRGQERAPACARLMEAERRDREQRASSEKCGGGPPSPRRFRAAGGDAEGGQRRQDREGAVDRGEQTGRDPERERALALARARPEPERRGGEKQEESSRHHLALHFQDRTIEEPEPGRDHRRGVADPAPRREIEQEPARHPQERLEQLDREHLGRRDAEERTEQPWIERALEEDLVSTEG